MKNDSLKQITWAIDPFLEDRKLHKQTAKMVTMLTKQTGAKVEPVFILGPDELNIYLGMGNDWASYYKPAAERALKSVVAQLKIPNALAPKVLVQHQPRTRKAVDLLLSHAQKTHSDLIVVSTHARTGVARLFLGSFAETLILQSRIPVATVNPESRVSRHLKRILFPTDLDAGFQEVFLSAVKLARDLNAEITLFHRVNQLAEPFLTAGAEFFGGSWTSPKMFFEQEVQRARAVAEDWVALAKNQGVPVHIQVDKSAKNLTDSIVAFAKRKNMDLIALASESGAVASVVLGSVSRQVIRKSHCPVWLLHSEPSDASMNLGQPRQSDRPDDSRPRPEQGL